MPRTKVTKNSKRNREVAQREERIREFETTLDQFLNDIELKCTDHVGEIDAELEMLKERTSSTVLQMRMSEFLLVLPDINKLSDWTQQNTTALSTNSLSHSASASTLGGSASTSMIRSGKVLNPNDEGYLTEDSSSVSGSCGGSYGATAALSISQNFLRSQKTQQRGRTPGPFDSARARQRRSRSADVAPGSALKPKASAKNQQVLGRTESERSSRSKIRTPVAPRPKAFSADRTPLVLTTASVSVPMSPVTAIMRWPKPGEMVLSKYGSPVVAQVMPDKFANVNIPVKNGVLSLQPKKLSELQPEFIDAIDAETLNQIRTLHANLNLIVNMADKSARNHN